MLEETSATLHFAHFIQRPSHTKLKNPVYKDERWTLYEPRHLSAIFIMLLRCTTLSSSVTNAERTTALRRTVQRQTVVSMAQKVETPCIMFFFANFWPLLCERFFPHCRRSENTSAADFLQMKNQTRNVWIDAERKRKERTKGKLLFRRSFGKCIYSHPARNVRRLFHVGNVD